MKIIQRIKSQITNYVEDSRIEKSKKKYERKKQLAEAKAKSFCEAFRVASEERQKTAQTVKNETIQQDAQNNTTQQKQVLRILETKDDQQISAMLNKVSVPDGIYNTIKSSFKKNITANDSRIKCNASRDSSYYMLGFENLGFDYQNLIANQYRIFIKTAFTSGPQLISLLQDTFQSWVYRKYPIATKIIAYPITRGYSKLVLQQKNRTTNTEKISSDHVCPNWLWLYQQKLDEISEYIINAIITAEKYGGCYVYYDVRNDIMKIKNRFEIVYEGIDFVVFCDDDQRYPSSNIIKFTSQNLPDSSNYKKMLEGWGFGWFDVYWDAFRQICEMMATIEECSHWQQRVILKDNFASQARNEFGIDLETSVSRVNSTSNNSIIAIDKESNIEMLQSNYDLEKAMDTCIKYITTIFSIPKKAFDDSSSGGIDNSEHKEATTISDALVHEKILFYDKVFIRPILKLIKSYYETQKQVLLDVTDIYIDHAPPEPLSKDQEIEMELKKSDLLLKQAQAEEIRVRLKTLANTGNILNEIDDE